MRFDTDIVIVGGGLNGPALALALASIGLRSVLLDAQKISRRKNPRFDGRAYALSLSSRRMLEALGLWSGLQENAEPILDIKVSDGRPGEGTSPLFLHFDHREIADGPMGALIEDRYLRLALLNAVEENPLIDHRAPVQAVTQSIVPGGIEIGLDSGEALRAALLVGCDGKRSGVATRAGVGRTGWDYSQTSLVCAVKHELPHHGIAHQLFLPAGPLAILPLPGNRSSIVWTESAARAIEISDLTTAAYLAELRPRFGDFLGEISLAGDRYAYPLGLSLANAFVAERVALAGDAAHGIHPLAGQGLNLGLRDVAALAEVLSDARQRGEDIGTPLVLARYQRWRRFDTSALAVATDTINRVFSNDNPLLRLGRDLALGAINTVPAARRTLIREAAGLTGDLPKLLKGRPLA